MRGMGTDLPLIPLGTKTKVGKVSMVGCIEGERYYWMVKEHTRAVSMIPATAMEQYLPDGQRSEETAGLGEEIHER